MPNRRDLKMDKYGISRDRYRELYYFCKQYTAKRAQLVELRELSGVAQDGMPHGSTVGKPTEAKALKAVELAKDVDLIEHTAKDIDALDWPYLLRNVCYGTPAEELPLHQGRRQFYQARRRFFWLLDRRKG